MSRDFYDLIAEYYEPMQSDLDPVKIAGTVDSLIKKFCQTDGEGPSGTKVLADLGCGTGNITASLANDFGYDTIGIDNSEGMLQVAMGNHPGLLWVKQDIRNIELYGACDVFTCLTDTLNHITDPSDIEKIFASFKDYLVIGGLFIFDCATLENLKDTLGDNVFFQDFDNVTLLWNNSYSDEISTSEITLFYSDNGIDYKRADTTVYERYYSESFWRELAEKNGMEILHKEPGFDNERDIYVLRRTR